MTRRNPRRAYDAQGREFEPLTIGRMLAMGIRHVTASCNRSGYFHTAEIPADSLPPPLSVRYVALRLRCSACGSRDIDTRLDWRLYKASGRV